MLLFSLDPPEYVMFWANDTTGNRHKNKIFLMFLVFIG